MQEGETYFDPQGHALADGELEMADKLYKECSYEIGFQEFLNKYWFTATPKDDIADGKTCCDPIQDFSPSAPPVEADIVRTSPKISVQKNIECHEDEMGSMKKIEKCDSDDNCFSSPTTFEGLCSAYTESISDFARFKCHEHHKKKGEKERKRLDQLAESWRVLAKEKFAASDQLANELKTSISTHTSLIEGYIDSIIDPNTNFSALTISTNNIKVGKVWEQISGENLVEKWTNHTKCTMDMMNKAKTGVFEEHANLCISNGRLIGKYMDELCSKKKSCPEVKAQSPKVEAKPLPKTKILVSKRNATPIVNTKSVIPPPSVPVISSKKTTIGSPGTRKLDLSNVPILESKRVNQQDDDFVIPEIKAKVEPPKIASTPTAKTSVIKHTSDPVPSVNGSIVQETQKQDAKLKAAVMDSFRALGEDLKEVSTDSDQLVSGEFARMMHVDRSFFGNTGYMKVLITTIGGVMTELGSVQEERLVILCTSVARSLSNRWTKRTSTGSDANLTPESKKIQGFFSKTRTELVTKLAETLKEYSKMTLHIFNNFQLEPIRARGHSIGAEIARKWNVKDRKPPKSFADKDIKKFVNLFRFCGGCIYEIGILDSIYNTTITAEFQHILTMLPSAPPKNPEQKKTKKSQMGAGQTSPVAPKKSPLSKAYSGFRLAFVKTANQLMAKTEKKADTYTLLIPHSKAVSDAVCTTVCNSNETLMEAAKCHLIPHDLSKMAGSTVESMKGISYSVDGSGEKLTAENSSIEIIEEGKSITTTSGTVVKVYYISELMG